MDLTNHCATFPFFQQDEAPLLTIKHVLYEHFCLIGFLDVSDTTDAGKHLKLLSRVLPHGNFLIP
jgi:hypothetical protein